MLLHVLVVMSIGMTIENFKNNDVITDYIQTVDGSSGVAPIWVDESGQNRIIVIPGANDSIDGSLTIEALEKIGKPDVWLDSLKYQ